jgi:hypothetical protein
VAVSFIGGGNRRTDIPYNPKNLPLGWDGKVKIIYSFAL